VGEKGLGGGKDLGGGERLEWRGRFGWRGKVWVAKRFGGKRGKGGGGKTYILIKDRPSGTPMFSMFPPTHMFNYHKVGMLY